jgi:hypothetical protein
MALDKWLDDLAKDSAQGLSRRQMFSRMAAGAGAIMLALFGIRRSAAANNCGKLCAECCQNNFPRGGPELGECIRLCHQGEGLCGPIVCPEG